MVGGRVLTKAESESVTPDMMWGIGILYVTYEATCVWVRELLIRKYCIMMCQLVT